MDRDRYADAHDPNDIHWWSDKAPQRKQPANIYEALLEAAPGVEPDTSIAESMELRESLAEAVDTLPDDDRWIIEMLVVARLSLRFTARVLGVPKTTLARRRDVILAHLRRQLLECDAVQRRLRD